MRIKRIIPEWKKPVATERRYRSALVRAMDDYIREVKASLKDIQFDTALRTDEADEEREARADGIIDDIAYLWNHLKAVANQTFAAPIASLPNIFSRVSSFNDKQWQRVVKVSTGFTIPASRDRDISGASAQALRESSPTGLGINAYREEPWLEKLQDAWVSNNTDLIKSLPSNLDGKIQQLVKSAVVNGTSASNLADQIQAEYGNSRYRAELIAIDQIQKANAALTEQRQRDAGCSGYIWRGVEDQRERPAHRAREGQHFEWDKPPADGHPGQPVRCRCWAEPDFTGSLFDVDA